MLQFAFVALVSIGFFLAISAAIYLLIRRQSLNNSDDKPLPKLNFQSRPVRFGIVGIMIVVLLIPLGLVENTVAERHGYYTNVLSDISSRWGGNQSLIGPILIVPFSYRYQKKTNQLNKNGVYQEVTQWHESEHRAVLLADNLNISGKLTPEYRSRGIYDSLVYRLQLTTSGNFEQLENRVRKITQPEKLHQIHWQQAYISIGLSDPSGVDNINKAQVNDQIVRFSPGSRWTEVLPKGLHIPVDLSQESSRARTNFDLGISLKGSQGFRVAPVADQTTLKLTSSWPHPSFHGDLLPARHEIDEKNGFNADWSVSRLVRSYPQQWVADNEHHSLEEIDFGVELFEPVTIYTETTRAVKYGFLFIGLTFLTLLLVEWVTGVSPGYVQYFLIGTALSLFYLLLIALAEHTGFLTAYLTASGIVISMVGLYTQSILKKRALSGMLSIILLTLYSVLYMILQSEDYALLSGTFLITITLATSMYFTRDLNRQPPNQ